MLQETPWKSLENRVPCPFGTADDTGSPPQVNRHRAQAGDTVFVLHPHVLLGVHGEPKVPEVAKRIPRSSEPVLTGTGMLPEPPAEDREGTHHMVGGSDEAALVVDNSEERGVASVAVFGIGRTVPTISGDSARWAPLEDTEGDASGARPLRRRTSARRSKEPG